MAHSRNLMYFPIIIEYTILQCCRPRRVYIVLLLYAGNRDELNNAIPVENPRTIFLSFHDDHNIIL